MHRDFICEKLFKGLGKLLKTNLQFFFHLLIQRIGTIDYKTFCVLVVEKRMENSEKY